MIQIKSAKDILICQLCGEKYTRSNKSNHNKSKIHQKFAVLNDDIRIFMVKKKEIAQNRIITTRELKYDIAENNIKENIINLI